MAINITLHHIIEALKQVPEIGAENNLSVCYSLWLILQGYTGNKTPLNRVMVSGTSQSVMDWLSSAWEAWPQFSGDPTFPIAGASQAWLRNQNEKSFWIGHQGEYRLGLVAFLLERAKGQIEVKSKEVWCG